MRTYHKYLHYFYKLLKIMIPVGDLYSVTLCTDGGTLFKNADLL